MQMWHLPAIFAADLLVGFYFFRKEQICANPFFPQVLKGFFVQFWWCWRIHTLILKTTFSFLGVKNVRSVPRILGQNTGNAN